MKLKVIMSVAVLTFATVGAISSARALSFDPVETANVPFTFYAGGKRMPAGKYTIEVDVETDTLLLSDDSGRNRIFLTGIPNANDDYRSELVFEHSGNAYALREMKSDRIDLSLDTKTRQPIMQSRSTGTKVIVAANR